MQVLEQAQTWSSTSQTEHGHQDHSEQWNQNHTEQRNQKHTEKGAQHRTQILNAQLNRLQELWQRTGRWSRLRKLPAGIQAESGDPESCFL